MSATRPPAVAGLFYPADRVLLRNMISSMLTESARAKLEGVIKALIAPHAGYIYSGPIAANAYRQWEGEHVNRVILMGPAHRVPIRGLALPTSERFATPLGDVDLDRDAMEEVASLTQVVYSDAAHEFEHSLEVHLPFLQTVLADFKLVPFVVGDASPYEVAEVLNLLWGDDATRIVISSDLSHYLPYEEAIQIDRATVEQILKLQYPVTHDRACGATPINGLLAAAHSHPLKAHLLDLRNSGDTAGDKLQVVGYTAIAFTEAGSGA